MSKRTPREPWQDAPLDPGIAPLVEAVRAAGMETVESCEGHAGREGWGDFPYIVLRCDDPARVTAWVDRAEAQRRRRRGAAFRQDRLILAIYEGDGLWRVRGPERIAGDENARIIAALRDTL